ncbi:DUF3352 domain-containing protein [Pseudanabaena sp. 'Roaring Creek']|uniref:DUF3352 domain-containing protein n=1 Tax=Pseudanabaena sp. 'Roaring Creek' TaxID=1681830 RepID=UPI0006D7A2F8|nr:DUF3352 domain-containing protein [Pseudanabaena sp. 'Roaring Creek']
MTETKPNLLPLIGGAAVVVAGGVGAYFFFNKPTITPTASGSTGTLTIVPKQSLMAMSLSTDGEALSKLEQFLSPETKKLYDDMLAKVKTNLSTGDFDYEKDVKPWIGKNITIAILPSTKTASLLPRTQAVAPVRYVPMSDTGSVQFVQDKVTPDTKAVPNILVVVEVKDKVGAEKFLTDRVKTKAGGKEKQSDYKGVKVTQYGEGTNASVTAMVGDYLIVTPQEQTTQKAIDTFKGEASLAGSVGADDLKIQNPVFQVFVPNFGESIVQLSALSPESQTIPPESLEQLKKLKSLNMGFGIDDAGIRFKALGKFDPDAIAALKNSPNKVIAQIPSQAFMVINGSNINSSWEQFVKSAEKTPELKKSIDDTRTQLKSSPLALDLDKDIFGWMDGEYALAPIEGKPEGILAQTQGLAPLLLIQTTKRAAGESLLTKLDDFVAKNGGKVSKKDVGGVAVTEWSAPGAPGAIVSHGWSQQDVVFLTASPIVSLFVPKPTAAIDGDATFKSVISTLPTSNVGYFYIDADKTWNIVQAFMPAAEKAKTPPEAKALIESIRGLAITANYPSQDTASVEAILALKKGGK